MPVLIFCISQSLKNPTQNKYNTRPFGTDFYIMATEAEDAVSVTSSPLHSRPSSPIPSHDPDPIVHTIPIVLNPSALPIFLLHHSTKPPPPPFNRPVEARLKPKSSLVQLDYPLNRRQLAEEKVERWGLGDRESRNTLQARIEDNESGYIGRIIDGKVLRLQKIKGEGVLGARLRWLDDEVEAAKKARRDESEVKEDVKGVVLSVKGEGQMSKLQKAVREEEGEAWRRCRLAEEDESWNEFERGFGEVAEVEERMLEVKSGKRIV